MRFLRPDLAVWLLAAPIVVVAWWLHYRYKWAHRRRELLSAQARRLSRRTPARLDRAVLALAVTIVLLLAGAMMRPQVRDERSVPTFERRDLMVILDRSLSMHARDVPPSRFGRAIEELQYFLRRKPDTIDRVGLIGFADRPVVLSYPTDDMESLSFYLDWAGEDPTPLFGTNIAEALMSAVDAAGREPQQVPPLFVVVSDGEDQSGQLERAAQAVRRQGIAVHSIGIGSDASVPMPVRQEDGSEAWLRDDTGRLVRTRFEEGSLQRLAALTGGTYFRSRTGGELLAALDAIALEERRQTGWRTEADDRDIHQVLLAAAAVATLLLVALS